MKNDAPRPAPSPRPVWVYVFGILTALGISGGGLFLLTQLPAYWKETREVWTETSGLIRSVSVEGREIETGSQPRHDHSSVRYTVFLDCTWEAESRNFSGRLPAPLQAPASAEQTEAGRVAAFYRPGNQLSLFYNPADPAKARLEANAPEGLFWMGLIFSLLMMPAGAGLGWWCWKEWRTPFLSG